MFIQFVGFKILDVNFRNILILIKIWFNRKCNYWFKAVYVTETIKLMILGAKYNTISNIITHCTDSFNIERENHEHEQAAVLWVHLESSIMTFSMPTKQK